MRRGKSENIKVTSWCLVGGLWALLSSPKRHVASLAGMASKKDKGILELLSHLGAFCTKGPKAGLTKDEVFVSTSVSLWKKCLFSKDEL